MRRSRAELFKDMIEQLRFDIATGSIATGGRFPSERDLATRFAVSRTTIREVVRALELIGLVVIKRGRDGGIFTTSNCQELAGTSFTSLLALEPAGFAKSLEFRKIVEPQAASLAAVRATEAEVKTLRRSLDMISDGETTVDRYIESNRLFHSTVARATGNPYIFNVLSQFFEAPETTATARQAAASQWSLIRYFHGKIFEAIELRDFKQAETWMDAHLAQMEADLSRARHMTRPRPPKRIE
jgi:GntR family transcriptional regulator, transcriptional repressor for pyruvate dehydrogenase complex